MKILSLVFFAALALSQPALAEDPWGVSIEAAESHCDPDRSISFYAAVEFQVGLWAWRPEGKWKMCVNDGGTSTILVKFKNEPYRALITINGSHAHLAPPADESWAFAFTRQDSIAGKPSALPRQESFVLSRGESHTFVLTGKYKLQGRNLRLKITRTSH